MRSKSLNPVLYIYSNKIVHTLTQPEECSQKKTGIFLPYVLVLAIQTIMGNQNSRDPENWLNMACEEKSLKVLVFIESSVKQCCISCCHFSIKERANNSKGEEKPRWLKRAGRSVLKASTASSQEPLQPALKKFLHHICIQQKSNKLNVYLQRHHCHIHIQRETHTETTLRLLKLWLYHAKGVLCYMLEMLNQLMFGAVECACRARH